MFDEAAFVGVIKVTITKNGWSSYCINLKGMLSSKANAFRYFINFQV